ncbi:MAG: ferric reductase-like transmembrane domain-containing protein [Paracoccaceae bacterium]|jgi:predicted ferric reductase|nr:ferric reductase-like transmembrane domain-containing protein [Paracoccaceae bacterium]
MGSFRAILIWAAVATAVTVPVAVALGSPLLAWREPIYIIAGFAGIVAMALLLLQPLLAGGYLPGLPMRQGRYLHRWTGALILLAVIIHVAGLWLTSPPDVIDALLFASPTPFSAWGVVAMWAVFAAALLALLRRPLRIGIRPWRLGHSALALIIVLGSAIHAVLIHGTMGTVSKTLLCILAVAATLKVLTDLRTSALLGRSRG